MRRTRSIVYALLGLLGAAAAPVGCSSVTDFSDPACDTGDANAVRSLRLMLAHMEPHTGKYVEGRLVTADQVVVGRVVLDPLPRPDFELRVHRALPPGVVRLDLFADVNLNEVYDGIPTDHAWRLGPCASGVYNFTHTTAFQEIDDASAILPGADFTMRFDDFVVHASQTLELYLIDLDADRRTVGYYRMSELPEDSFALRLVGVIEPDVQYRVSFFVDHNGNGGYDPPDIDHAWRVEATGAATGLALTFLHTPQFTDIAEDLGL